MESVMKNLCLTLLILGSLSLYHCYHTGEETHRNRVGCSTNDELIEDTANCTRYWECSNGKKIHMMCPDYPNLWFNALTNQCDYIRNYPILKGCGDALCSDGNSKKYAVPNDKKKFIWCLNGKAHVYPCCEEDKICRFDVDQQLCDFAPSDDSKNVIPKDCSYRDD